VDVESKIQALKARLAENPKISAKEVGQELRELMSCGVRPQRLIDDVGFSTYTIYKIRKDAGICRPPRPLKKFHEVKLAPANNVTPVVSRSRSEITLKIVRVGGGLEIKGEHSEILALIKGIL
jgi:hypothetical protein